MTNASGEWDYSEFIREFVTDPANVPDVMCLYGYLGQSTEDGHERLYQSPSLTPYIEVPTKAILYRKKAAHEHDPLGGVTLWVRRDAKLIHKMTPTALAQASYFAGALQADVAARAANIPGPMFDVHRRGPGIPATLSLECVLGRHPVNTVNVGCLTTKSDCEYPQVTLNCTPNCTQALVCA